MNDKPRNAILWWAAGGFALLLIAWTCFFFVASKHRVPEVPLATKEKAP